MRVRGAGGVGTEQGRAGGGGWGRRMRQSAACWPLGRGRTRRARRGGTCAREIEDSGSRPGLGGGGFSVHGVGEEGWGTPAWVFIITYPIVLNAAIT